MSKPMEILVIIQKTENFELYPKGVWPADAEDAPDIGVTHFIEKSSYDELKEKFDLLMTYVKIQVEDNRDSTIGGLIHFDEDNVQVNSISEDESIKKASKLVKLAGGLTKRDYFAAMSMQGLLSNLASLRKEGFTDKEVEEFALMRADGLIKALNASEGQRKTTEKP